MKDEEAQPFARMGEDGEYDDLRGKSRDEVVLMHNKMLNDQEKHLDAILGVTAAIKYEGQTFDTEVNK